MLAKSSFAGDHEDHGAHGAAAAVAAGFALGRLEQTVGCEAVFFERRVNQAIAGLKLTRSVVAHRPQTIAGAARAIALGTEADLGADAPSIAAAPA